MAIIYELHQHAVSARKVDSGLRSAASFVRIWIEVVSGPLGVSVCDLSYYRKLLFFTYSTSCALSLFRPPLHIQAHISEWVIIYWAKLWTAIPGQVSRGQWLLVWVSSAIYYKQLRYLRTGLWLDDTVTSLLFYCNLKNIISAYYGARLLWHINDWKKRAKRSS